MMQLTDRQRAILEEMAAGRRRPHDEVQRAAISLQSADGARTRHLAETFGVSEPTSRLWRARWTHATSQLAAAAAEADAATLGGVIQPVWHEAPRRGRPATVTPEHGCWTARDPLDPAGIGRGGDQPWHGPRHCAAQYRPFFQKKRT